MRKEKLNKMRKLINILKYKYNIKYISSNLDWSYFNVFELVRPIYSIDEIIEMFEDEEEYQIYTFPNGNKKMIL